MYSLHRSCRQNRSNFHLNRFHPNNTGTRSGAQARSWLRLGPDYSDCSGVEEAEAEVDVITQKQLGSAGCFPDINLQPFRIMHNYRTAQSLPTSADTRIDRWSNRNMRTAQQNTWARKSNIRVSHEPRRGKNRKPPRVCRFVRKTTSSPFTDL